VIMWFFPYLRRHMRLFVALALMAWLSASVAGVANCYLVQSHKFGKHLPIASAQRAEFDLGKEASRPLQAQGGDHVVAAGSSDHSTDTGKENCDRFCVDESSTVAKADADLPGLLVLVRVVSADWQPPTPADSASMWRSVERQVSQGLPLFLRLLRLSI
jgi:hypothetical protein